MIAPESVRHLVIGRLLILQNKRLLLAATERRMLEHHDEALRERVERFRAEVQAAQHNYRETILRWGNPDMQDYLTTAYSRLIEMAGVLGDQLHVAMDDLPPAERYEVSADVEILDEMVERWTEAKRQAMAASVA